MNQHQRRRLTRHFIYLTTPTGILSKLFTLIFLYLLLNPALGWAADKDAASKDLLPFEQGDTLETIREKIKHNGYSFTVKDYGTNTSFKRFVPGRHRSLIPSEQTGRRWNLDDIQRQKTLPIRFDWRDQDGKSYIGPVRNQGAAGTCYAFGACAAAEGAYNFKNGLYDDQCIDFSESYIAWSLGSIKPYSDHFSGGYGADYDYFELFALTFPGEETFWEGICLESDFPYQDTKPTETRIEESFNHPRIYFSDWGRVYPDDYEETTTAIKEALMTYGVIDVAVDVSDAFDAYESGVYEDTNTSTTSTPYYNALTNHAVALVGWDDAPPEGGGGCWILRNSWGENWGEGGYMRIRYQSAHVNCAAAYLLYEASPSVFTGHITQLDTSDSLCVSGQVLGLESPGSAYFEYGPTTTYGSVTASVECIPEELNTVECQLTGLEIGRIYHYRIVVTDATDTLYGADRQIDFSAPELITEPEHQLNRLSVDFDATANTHRLPASIHFEYGPSIDCDQATTPTIMLGTDVETFCTIDDLLPDTRYWYRAIVENALGRDESEVESFKTRNIIYWEDFNRTEEDWGGWTQEYVTGEESWYFENYGSDYVAFATWPDEWLEEKYVTRLVSPTLDLPDQPIQFVFLHAQPSWESINDIMSVYYRTSPEAPWVLINGARYEEAVEEWTRRELMLPDPGPTYQIAFEGESYESGDGIALDDVTLILSSLTAVNDWTLYDAPVE